METVPSPEVVVEEAEFRRIARVALFNTLIDYHHQGHCTFEEAVAEYQSEIKEQGIAE